MSDPTWFDFGKHFASQREYVQHWNIRLHGFRNHLNEFTTAQTICDDLNKAKHYIDRAIFQKEKSNKGYEHWHIHLTTIDTKVTKKEHLEWAFRLNPHVDDEDVEASRIPTASFKYASKLRSRMEGPYEWQRGIRPNAPLSQKRTILSFFGNP